MYSKKNNGPRIEPCGTPCLTLSPVGDYTVIRIDIVNNYFLIYRHNNKFSFKISGNLPEALARI
jgi:hypothetical protein